MTRARTVTAAAALALTLTACASGGATPSATPNAPTSAAPTAESPTAEPRTAAETSAPGSKVDGGDVDWATVDLTSIDWNTVDLRTVDWAAAQENPSAENLAEEVGQIIQSRLNPGRATLVIGDETFEFDSFDCASGHDNTRSTRFSFTTNSFGEFDGVRTQMQFTVSDESSTGQTEGEGVRHRISFNDIDDFENPSIDWSMGGADSVSIDGYELSVSGTFNDGLTEGVTEEVPGSLEAECSDMSRF